MASLPITLKSFPRRLPTSTSMPVSMPEVLHSAITTGHGLKPFGGVGDYSLSELAWKLPLTHSILHAANDEWRRRASSDELDPSEKGAIAYFLGNVQTGVIARRLFGMTHVAHLSKLDPKTYIRDDNGRSLPDFVAANVISRETLVVESKGSFGTVSGRTLDQALRQLSHRLSIVGFRAPLRYAQLSEFSGLRWRARLVRQSGSTTSYRASAGGLLYSYYAPLRNLLRGSGGTNQSGYLTARLGGVLVGMRTSIVRALATAETSANPLSGQRSLLAYKPNVDSRFDELKGISREVALSQSQIGDGSIESDTSFEGKDGVFVRVLN